MYRRHDLSDLIANDPSKAAKQILGVLRQNGVHRRDAAKTLGCAYRTLLRWIERLGLGNALQRLEDEAGRAGRLRGGGRQGGRPKGSLDMFPRVRRSNRAVQRERSRARADITPG